MVYKLDLSAFVLTVSDNISWRFYILISVLITLQLAIRSFRFKFLFNHMFKDRFFLRESFILTGASFFIAMITPNKLGDTARGFFFKSRGTEITAITLIEYVFDTLILVGIAFFGVMFIYRDYLTVFLLAFAVALIALIISLCLLKYNKLRKVVGRFDCYQKIGDRLKLVKSHFKASVRSKFVLLTGFVFSCLFHAIYFYIFYMILHQLGAEISLVDALFSSAVGMFIGSLTFVPMGMGIRDVSTYGLLCCVGVGPEIIISSVVIMRSLSIPLMLTSSICYFIAINFFHKKTEMFID